MKPSFVDSVFLDSDDLPLHAWIYVCPSCADRYKLETDDSCVGGCMCHVNGCSNETSLVHTIYDYREVEYQLTDDERLQRV